ncbi:hypothetical protein CRU92_05085 [Arcobacter sp. FW59]|nr:hypothetical protein CRU92_05085 [Arcobacter sp. FW59]
MKKFDWKDTFDKILSTQGGLESLSVILFIIIALIVFIAKLIFYINGNILWFGIVVFAIFYYKIKLNK